MPENVEQPKTHERRLVEFVRPIRLNNSEDQVFLVKAMAKVVGLFDVSFYFESIPGSEEQAFKLNIVSYDEETIKMAVEKLNELVYETE